MTPFPRRAFLVHSLASLGVGLASFFRRPRRETPTVLPNPGEAAHEPGRLHMEARDLRVGTPIFGGRVVRDSDGGKVVVFGGRAGSPPR